MGLGTIGRAQQVGQKGDLKMTTGKTKFAGVALAILFAFGLAGSAHTQTSCGDSVCYTYDELGRLTTAEYANGANESYSYDPAGNRTTHVVAGGAGIPSIVIPLNGFTIIPLFASAEDLPTFTILDSSATEGSPVEFTVFKSGTTTFEHSVDYATSAGTAASGTDFTAETGTLTFATTETQKTISVATTPDTDPEANETFSVSLSNPTQFARINIATAEGTIVDDDGGGGGGGTTTVLTDTVGNVLSAYTADYSGEYDCVQLPTESLCTQQLMLLPTTVVWLEINSSVLISAPGYSKTGTGRELQVENSLYGVEP